MPSLRWATQSRRELDESEYPRHLEIAQCEAAIEVAKARVDLDEWLAAIELQSFLAGLIGRAQKPPRRRCMFLDLFSLYPNPANAPVRGSYGLCAVGKFSEVGEWKAEGLR